MRKQSESCVEDRVNYLYPVLLGSISTSSFRFTEEWNLSAKRKVPGAFGRVNRGKRDVIYDCCRDHNDIIADSQSYISAKPTAERSTKLAVSSRLCRERSPLLIASCLQSVCYSARGLSFRNV